MTREEILDAAKQCVCGGRDEQYGSPERSFDAVARLWGTYLLSKPREGGAIDFDAHDVAAMMVLFKVARIATGQEKPDNWVDCAGYAACGGEIQCGGGGGA